MELQLKRRIVGIVILVVLMVVLAPLLFKGSNNNIQKPNIPETVPTPPPAPQVVQTDVSNIPQVKKVEAIATLADKSSTEKPALKTKVKPQKKAPKHAVKAPKKVVEHIKPTAKFVAVKGPRILIQVGVFSQKTNADNLVKKLRAGGFTAYSMAVKRWNTTAYRVYVRGKNGLRTTDILLKKLRKDFKITGIAVKE